MYAIAIPQLCKSKIGLYGPVSHCLVEYRKIILYVMFYVMLHVDKQCTVCRIHVLIQYDYRSKHANLKYCNIICDIFDSVNIICLKCFHLLFCSKVHFKLAQKFPNKINTSSSIN